MRPASGAIGNGPMKSITRFLPLAIMTCLSVIAIWHGPIAQFPDYHDFADKTARFGIPYFANVLFNLGFALVPLWVWLRLTTLGNATRLGFGWSGYRLFLIGVFLTAFSSGWYHLAPDNVRLVGDRLTIALACAGLLAGVWGDTQRRSSKRLAVILSASGLFSVVWWYATELAGIGDLRPYILFQIAPIIMIPLWQWIYGSDRADRIAFSMALILYAAARLAEIYDHEIGALLVVLTGHTVKHLLTTVAVALIACQLVTRVRQQT